MTLLRHWVERFRAYLAAEKAQRASDRAEWERQWAADSKRPSRYKEPSDSRDGYGVY